jgi:hypothetical protein
MFVDRNLLFDSELDLGDAAGDRCSTYSVDLGAAKDIARGRQLYVVIIIDETFATSTSINFQFVTDTLATLASPTVQCETGAIAIASLTAGRAPIVLPVGTCIDTEEQYCGLYYDETGTGSTAGKVTAFLAVDAP